uniref:Uncharacterized protein n=1 Tax=Anguilla anguilla TaxID=7936 RepID=A0A0E9V0K1_ANGAN
MNPYVTPTFSPTLLASVRPCETQSDQTHFQYQ